MSVANIRFFSEAMSKWTRYNVILPNVRKGRIACCSSSAASVTTRMPGSSGRTSSGMSASCR